MLKLGPTCENCTVSLLPDSTEAMLCAFECTFCWSCVETHLENVCPFCGGGFSPRPVRPASHWKGGKYPGRCRRADGIRHRPVGSHRSP